MRGAEPAQPVQEFGHLCSLAGVACGARQEFRAKDPEVFPYGAGTIRAVRGADLLEREAELRVLETLVAQASGGDGRVGLIEGSPGIGKTSLVSAAARLAAEAGMRCLSARGSPMERAFPFGVVRQLFEPVLAAEPAERAEVFGGPAARVERLLAGGDELTSHGGGPFAVYHGLYWLTANLSGAGALALLVDDLQWADPPSLGAIEYLGLRLEGLPVLLVISSRRSEPGFDRSVLDILGREPAARMVAPHTLSEAATAELVRTRLSAAATDEFCLACHAATAGNPLLTAELAAALAAEGVTGQTDDVAKVTAIGPEAVAAAVRLRLAALPGQARSLAEAACVLGDGAPLEDAAALAGLELPAAAAAATALAEADVVRAEETVTFVHPVVRGRGLRRAGAVGAARRARPRRTAAGSAGTAGRKGSRPGAALPARRPTPMPSPSSARPRGGRWPTARPRWRWSICNARSTNRSRPGSCRRFWPDSALPSGC